jgi:hypothetical protein
MEKLEKKEKPDIKTRNESIGYSRSNVLIK